MNLARFKSTGFLVALIVLFALLLRVVYVSTLEPKVFWYDGQEYQRLARGILEDGAYLNAAGDPTAFWPPGYPAYLAAMGAEAPLARLVQALLGALSVLLVHTIARRFLSARQSILAAALCAVYPVYIYSTGSIMPVIPLAFLVTLVFALLSRGIEGMSLRPFFLAGLTGGLAVLTSASALPAMLLSAPWICLERRRAQKRGGVAAALVFLLTLLLVVGSWSARNYRHFDRIIPVSLNGGYNIWLGNYPGVKASTGNRWTPEMEAEFHALSIEFPDEAELDRALSNRAFEYIRRDPWHFITLSFSKAVNFWRLYPRPMTEDRPGLSAEKLISILSYGLALPFALFFLFATLGKWSGARLALIWFLAYTALHAVILSKFRFRLPLDGILLVFAAGGLGMLARRLGWRVLEDSES